MDTWCWSESRRNGKTRSENKNDFQLNESFIFDVCPSRPVIGQFEWKALSSFDFQVQAYSDFNTYPNKKNCLIKKKHNNFLK